MTQEIEQSKPKGKFYALTIDGKEYHVEQSSMTGAEIMQLGGIPLEVGLLRIFEDGTEKPVAPDEVIKFEGPGRRFKKQPHFKRG